MNYTPEQKNKYVTAIVVTLIVGGIGVYMVPNFVPVRAVIFQLLSLICLVAAVFVLVRYKTTAFTYIIRPRSLMHEDVDAEAALAGGVLDVTRVEPRYLDFVVSKKQGSRAPNMECVLGLDSLIAAWDISAEAKCKKCADAMEQARGQYGKADLYDYTVTLGLDKSLLLLFRDGEKVAAIRIEPDTELRDYLVSTAERNGKEE